MVQGEPENNLNPLLLIEIRMITQSWYMNNQKCRASENATEIVKQSDPYSSITSTTVWRHENARSTQ